jgi:hypothetical protein
VGRKKFLPPRNKIHERLLFTSTIILICTSESSFHFFKKIIIIIQTLPVAYSFLSCNVLLLILFFFHISRVHSVLILPMFFFLHNQPTTTQDILLSLPSLFNTFLIVSVVDFLISPLPQPHFQLTLQNKCVIGTHMQKDYIHRHTQTHTYIHTHTHNECNNSPLGSVLCG